MERPKLSLSIIAQNEEASIARAINSARDLVDEIIVVDGGSTDRTIAIAESLGATIIHNPWPGHRDQKNVALDHCSHPWILAIDCDEELSPELASSIHDFFDRNLHEQFDGAFCNRKVWFLGRWITHGDWYPDRKLRLFHNGKARWAGSHEHDKVELDGTSTRLHGDLHHFSFPNSHRFIAKISVFGDAYLKRQLESGKPWSLFATLFRPFWRFFRSYILRLGFLDGFPGFWIAIAIAFQTFARHSRAYEHTAPTNPPTKLSCNVKLALIYDRFTRGGGLENYLADFATALVSSGHEIEVITSRTSPETEKIPNRIHLLKRHGFTNSAKMRDFDTSAATILDSWNDFDVSIGFGRTTTHDLHRAGGGCHAVYSRMLPALKRLRPKNRTELELERELYTSGRTRHFVVNSSMVRDQLEEEYGVNQNAVTVIHTAVDASRFAPAPNQTTAKSNICHELGSDPERAAFLFVSLNHRRKGLARILDVWNDLDADLWVLGSPLTSSLKKQIESQGIENRIHSIPAQDPARYYAAADWFLHPSLYDACANTVLQSLASGLPGIISVQDGAHEFIEEGINGFLLHNPSDSSSLREQLERCLATSDSERAFLSQSARHSILSLTWERHLSNWQRLISNIA